MSQMVLRPRKKTGVDADDARRKREDSTVKIRKNKRKDNLLKKRTLIQSQQDASQPPLNRENLLESIPAMVQKVSSEDPAAQLEATTQFRKLLSIVPGTPRDEVIEAGVIPRLVKFLGRNEHAKLQYEAAWALTNVTAGSSEHTQVVIKHGAVPIFVQLLSSASDDVREQAAWALGNVAGDSATDRDLILGHGALMPLLALLNENSRLSILRNATWTLSKFCRVKPLPPFEKVKPALPVLRKLIDSNDEEVLTYACWSLAYLSDDPNDTVQAVFEAGVCPRLVGLMLHSSPKVILPATRTVGKILTGDDAQTQSVIDNNVLHSLYQLLTKNHQKSINRDACWTSINRDACWTISNITAGNRNQIQAVIAANIIPPLLHLLEHAEFDVKEEAGRAISNAILGGSLDQIRYLVSQGCIKSLCDLLICPEPKIVNQCLKGLENILKAGEADKEMGMNIYEQIVDECEGLDKIQNPGSYDKAVKLLKKYSGLGKGK